MSKIPFVGFRYLRKGCTIMYKKVLVATDLLEACDAPVVVTKPKVAVHAL